MSETQGYRVEYRDTRGRWHRQRAFYGLATEAVGAAADMYEVWRVIDAEGNQVAYADTLLGRSCGSKPIPYVDWEEPNLLASSQVAAAKLGTVTSL